MSKEHIEPQVGDVWRYKDGANVYLLRVDEETVESFTILGGSIFSATFKKKDFLENHIYLDKSKVNIEQLFEVCDEPQS